MKRFVWLLVKVGVSAALIAVLLRRLGAQSVLDVVGDARLGLLALAGVFLLGQTALSTLKWRLLLSAQGSRVPYRSLLIIYLISGFINLFMPSVAGGDAYRAVWLKRHTRSIVAALPSIVVERATGVAALAALAAAGLTLMAVPERAAWVLPGLTAAAAALYLLCVYPLGSAVAKRPAEKFFGLTGVLKDVLSASRPSGTFFAIVLLSFLFQLNTVLINWLYATSMGLSATLLHLLLIVPIVYMVEMIPISLNGVGLREGTFTVLFAQAGLPPEEGLALGLMVTLMRYVVGLVGGTLFTVSLLRRPAAGEAA